MTIILEGYLFKMSCNSRQFQRRYFKLHQSELGSEIMEYHRGLVFDRIALDASTIVAKSKKRKCMFSINKNAKVSWMCAESENVAYQWRMAIGKTISMAILYTKKSKLNSTLSSTESESSTASLSEFEDNGLIHQKSLEDKKVYGTMKDGALMKMNFLRSKMNSFSVAGTLFSIHARFSYLKVIGTGM